MAPTRPAGPHSAPHDDVYAGLLWTAEHAAELDSDADRIVVAGTSAGDGLVAALNLSVRDKGGPRLVGQLLMCPMETLRDVAVACADRIWRAGGSAELHVCSGGYHTFDLVVSDAAISRSAWQTRRSSLERALAAD